MNLFDRIARGAAASGLAILGGFHAGADDAVPESCATLLLLGPSGPRMWDSFTGAAEYSDGASDPLDRWSKRIIGGLAAETGARAIFPSDRPYPPFIAWALRSGQCWSSPVGLLVHATEGLLVSFRGALAHPDIIALPAAPASRPCTGCAGQPCRTACPVSAFGTGGYATETCHAYLDSSAGETCMSSGCAVRLCCPVGRGGRPSAQLAFHMRAFHPSGA